MAKTHHFKHPAIVPNLLEHLYVNEIFSVSIECQSWNMKSVHIFSLMFNVDCSTFI